MDDTKIKWAITTQHRHRGTIRRLSLPRNIAIYNSPTQVQDCHVELTKALKKFKFAKFRFLILLQSSNIGFPPFLYGSKRSIKKLFGHMVKNICVTKVPSAKILVFDIAECRSSFYCNCHVSVVFYYD